MLLWNNWPCMRTKWQQRVSHDKASSGGQPSREARCEHKHMNEQINIVKYLLLCGVCGRFVGAGGGVEWRFGRSMQCNAQPNCNHTNTTQTAAAARPRRPEPGGCS